MDFDALDQAPGMTMQNEVKEQYDRGTNAAQKLAEWMRQMGWGGVSHGGPIAGPVLMIPHAIEAGLGEPGKHGSMINKRYGSSFRLANVLTDLPLVPSEKEIFGASLLAWDNTSALQRYKTLRNLLVDFDDVSPWIVKEHLMPFFCECSTIVRV